ncbi:MAG: HAD family hydrolase [Clostridiales bacterium]|nr:HAD family hydrolase [Clostridiales bacterium]
MSKLIIFDFDGTIADSMWAWDELGEDTINENHLPLIDDYEDVIRTMSVPDFADYLSGIYPQLGNGKQILSNWHEKMVFKYCNQVSLKSGVREFLDYLKSNNYKLYLASATCYDVLNEALNHFDLKQYFDFILTEEIVGISKRNPQIYQVCIDRAKSDIDNTIVFEDAIHAVETVKNLGIKVCAIKDYSMRNHEEEIKKTADLYIEDYCNFNQLKNFILG